MFPPADPEAVQPMTGLVAVRGEAPTRTGFTLPEGLIVLAVLSAVASLALANVRLGERRMALDSEAFRIADVIRQAKTDALGSAAFQGAVPSGGYGAFFSAGEPDVAIRFADMNGNQQFDGDARRCTGECMERVGLEAGAAVLSFEPTGPFVTVTFTPPDPITQIHGGNSAASLERAGVAVGFASYPRTQKTIVIQSSGVITVE